MQEKRGLHRVKKVVQNLNKLKLFSLISKWNNMMRVTFSKEFPELGKRIKDCRVLSNKSLAELAAVAGISVPHWNRIENEKIQELPIATLRGIEKALSVDLGVKIDTETTNEV